MIRAAKKPARKKKQAKKAAKKPATKKPVKKKTKPAKPQAKPAKKASRGRPRKPKAVDPIQALWLSYVDGGRSDVAARNLLTEHFQYLVVSITERIAARLPHFVDVDGMRQAAQFGLMEAVEKFDPRMGYTFSTYASPRIRGAALDELRQTDPVPRLTRIRSGKRQVAEQELSQSLGRSPTEAEIAARMGCQEEAVAEAQPVDTISLEAIVCRNRDGKSLKVGDLMEARQGGLGIERSCRFFAWLTRGLDFEARVVLYLYHLAGHKMLDVGKILHISESRVSQVISQATQFLRKNTDRVEAFTELREEQQYQ